MYKTLRFEIVSGLNKGYFHDNNHPLIIDIIANLWQKIAQKEFEASGVYISSVILRECMNGGLYK